MAISTICPVLNEIRFLPAWLACVSKFCDDIVVVDTGSTDGSIEFLRANGVKVHLWPEKLDYKAWNTGSEGKVRNFMISQCKGDWIVPLDADELVGEDFIRLVKVLKENKGFVIGRFVHYMFWGDFNTLRARSLKPLLFCYGKWRPFRNWRGNYPNKIPRLFRNIAEIKYDTTPRHCLLQYKNYGRWVYHLPWLTRDFEVGFYHLHYIFGKGGANRDWELGQKVKTASFKGYLPKEVQLITGSK